MNNLEQLRAMRELLADPAHWTQGMYYLRKPWYKKSNAVPEFIPPEYMADTLTEATCYCLVGAAMKVTNALYPPHAATDALFAALIPKLTTGKSVVFWQDEPGRTHAEVLALIDAAIEREVANGATQTL
jgi:hypothetical protein